MKPKQTAGFALIASLAIMAVLVMIAVALYSMSNVATRTADLASARTQAQANAKMALMKAIGELQKTVGPDRAITASSGIYSTATVEVAKPNTTGVWESWDYLDPINPNAPIYYTTEKANRFQRWLVSSTDVTAVQTPDFINNPWAGETIELVGEGTLGSAAPDDDKVIAGLVPIADNGFVEGSYAWHVADESVKARVDLYRDPSRNATLAEKRALVAGHRPDGSVIKTFDDSLLSFLPNDVTPSDFTNAHATMGKVTSLDQAELLDQAQGKLQPLRNDITFHSLGVMADVRRGGLKEDLSSVFEMGSASANTPSFEFNNKRLYESTHGITGVSDPNWSALAGYYNSFRNLTTPNTDPSFSPQSGAAALDEVPLGYNPAPVIVKVETIFSLIARPITESWLPADHQVVKDYDGFISMIFTPVVTLHNPYNVNLSFHRMNVTFKNVPVAFNFMVKYPDIPGSYLSRSVVPGNFESLNEMLHHRQYRGDKEFGMNIANWSNFDRIDDSDAIEGPIIMKPGQTLVCGIHLDPDGSFKKDADLGSNTVAFDWQNELIKNIKAKPMFIPGLGFEVSSVNLSSLFKQPWNDKGHSWSSYFMLRDANLGSNRHPNSETTLVDEFYVEFRAQQPRWQTDQKPVPGNDQLVEASFEVTAQIQATEDDELVDYAELNFDYGNDSNIKDFFDEQIFRYPPKGDPDLTLDDIFASTGTTYSNQGGVVHPFAIISAYARTTNGGVYESNTRSEGSGLNLLQDGRLAGKPFLFHNPSRTSFTLDLAQDKPGVQSFELNIQPFISPGNFQDYMNVDSANRAPSLTGNRTYSGIMSGSYFELPSGPLQTIADFRRSNALTTSYLPHFVQPVGNSLLHPLMSADKVIQTELDISSDELLDHSVLANHALYDRFYFSTFATRGSETPDLVFEQFMNGSTPLPSQAFQPYLPHGQTLASAKTELFSAGKPVNNAYKSAAEYQMIRGPFNVNSTSVQAWKAVLAAMSKSEITMLLPDSGLTTATSTGAPITAMSLPNGEPILSAGYADKSAGWNGYRELSEPELQTLAEEIVEEVRLRGPFLSMSEFVNRRIGPSGPLTLSGALEAAIAKAEINEVEDATSSNSFLRQVPITTADISDTGVYAYKTPEASTGNPAAGAPGWVNQGDLLRILGPRATVRGDTFIIRVYGDAQDTSGKVEARAYGEAVVQRVPEYVAPGDRPSADSANKNFGRRFEVVSFRWLSPNEI